jgi:hypothetical protein
MRSGKLAGTIVVLFMLTSYRKIRFEGPTFFLFEGLTFEKFRALH